MVDRRFGVIINGATGRMGATQHVANLLAIAAEGGLQLRNGDRLVPDVLLVGRDAGRLTELAGAHNGLRWTTNLAEALAGRTTSSWIAAQPAADPLVFVRLLRLGSTSISKSPQRPPLRKQWS